MFVKALSDASSATVRTRAADALGILMRSQKRVDPVATEFITGARRLLSALYLHYQMS